MLEARVNRCELGIAQQVMRASEKQKGQRFGPEMSTFLLLGCCVTCCGFAAVQGAGAVGFDVPPALAVFIVFVYHLRWT